MSRVRNLKAHQISQKNLNLVFMNPVENVHSCLVLRAESERWMCQVILLVEMKFPAFSQSHPSPPRTTYLDVPAKGVKLSAFPPLFLDY